MMSSSQIFVSASCEMHEAWLVIFGGVCVLCRLFSQGFGLDIGRWSLERDGW